jgi:23S rRNA (cytosine1962-C5)-methyltransferase/23S rRNA (guanine2445-N2)-methyltransferase / 23S rRNA (guanine2069-N7)-methyltransferase
MSKHFRKWARRQPTTAYRVYDRDIPDVPIIVEVFGDHAIVWMKNDEEEQEPQLDSTEVIATTAAALELAKENIHFKVRSRMPGAMQYQKLGRSGDFLIAAEGELKFHINPYDYLDTGLFLDHRPLRQKIASGACGTGGKFLNLFCYTGSFSVAAAAAGFSCTSIDMSATYLNWATENFALNELSAAGHQFVREDILTYIKKMVGSKKEQYDLIFLDPPSFSNSSKMTTTLDVLRDHAWLIDDCMQLMKTGGVLLFSTNKRRFKLNEQLQAKYQIKDITRETIPQDFSDKKIHQCWEIRKIGS